MQEAGGPAPARATRTATPPPPCRSSRTNSSAPPRRPSSAVEGPTQAACAASHSRSHPARAGEASQKAAAEGAASGWRYEAWARAYRAALSPGASRRMSKARGGGAGAGRPAECTTTPACAPCE
jgi:hypothetical protein